MPDGQTALQMTCTPCQLDKTGNKREAQKIREQRQVRAAKARKRYQETNGPWKCPDCSKVWRRNSTLTTLQKGKKAFLKQCSECAEDLKRRQEEKLAEMERRHLEDEKRKHEEAIARQQREELKREKEDQYWAKLMERNRNSRNLGLGSPSNRSYVSPRRRG